MGLHNCKKANYFEVQNWLIENIPELTAYQKEKLKNDEILRFSPYYFYKKRKTVNNLFIRLTIIFFIPIWIILFIGLPFNFLRTGTWGYSKIEWLDKWQNNIGI